MTITRGQLRDLAKIGTEVMGVSPPLREEDQSLFSVSTISNGFLVRYTDVEEFDQKVPAYAPRRVGHPGPPLGTPPEMQTRHRWKLMGKTVFCKDAEEIKAAIDDALRITEKVKHLKAQDVLSGDDDFELGA